MNKKKRLFRIEFFKKHFYEFDTFREADKWAKAQINEKRILRYEEYYTIKEIKYKRGQTTDLSFSREIEWDEYHQLKSIKSTQS